MKLSDYKGEKAIEKFADLLGPISTIMTDKELRKMVTSYAEESKDSEGKKKKKPTKIEIIQKAIKSNASAVLEMMAILNDVPVEGYEPSFAELTVSMLEMLNDEELESLFTSQGQKETEKPSGSAMVNTEEKGN